eukprot:310703-Amphidinium_carterae.1
MRALKIEPSNFAPASNIVTILKSEHVLTVGFLGMRATIPPQSDLGMSPASSRVLKYSTHIGPSNLKSSRMSLTGQMSGEILFSFKAKNARLTSDSVKGEHDTAISSQPGLKIGHSNSKLG